MPRIKTYETRTEVQGAIGGRRATTEDLSFGRELTQLGQAGMSAFVAEQKRAEQEETSAMHAEMSKAHEEFTNKWRDTLQKAKPGDKVQEPFMQQYEEYMDKIENNVSTPGARRYVQEARGQLRSHFSETAMAGQVELAGQKERQNVVQSMNSRSAALVNDPTAFEMTLKMQGEGARRPRGNRTPRLCCRGTEGCSA
jgi:hypothetical protein